MITTIQTDKKLNGKRLIKTIETEDETNRFVDLRSFTLSGIEKRIEIKFEGTFHSIDITVMKDGEVNVGWYGARTDVKDFREFYMLMEEAEETLRNL